MRQNPHVRICGGPGSATTPVYPTLTLPHAGLRTRSLAGRRSKTEQPVHLDDERPVLKVRGLWAERVALVCVDDE